MKIQVKRVHPDQDATGGFLYELEPLEYPERFELVPGTRLEVVEVPGEEGPKWSKDDHASEAELVRDHDGNDLNENGEI